MSAVEETAGQVTDLGSSIKLTRNARGATQIELKVRSNEEPGLIEEAVERAQAIYDTLAAKYGGGS